MGAGAVQAASASSVAPQAGTPFSATAAAALPTACAGARLAQKSIHPKDPPLPTHTHTRMYKHACTCTHAHTFMRWHSSCARVSRSDSMPRSLRSTSSYTSAQTHTCMHTQTRTRTCTRRYAAGWQQQSAQEQGRGHQQAASPNIQCIGDAQSSAPCKTFAYEAVKPRAAWAAASMHTRARVSWCCGAHGCECRASVGSSCNTGHMRPPSQAPCKRAVRSACTPMPATRSATCICPVFACAHTQGEWVCLCACHSPLHWPLGLGR